MYTGASIRRRVPRAHPAPAVPSRQRPQVDEPETSSPAVPPAFRRNPWIRAEARRLTSAHQSWLSQSSPSSPPPSSNDTSNNPHHWPLNVESMAPVRVQPSDGNNASTSVRSQVGSSGTGIWNEFRDTVSAQVRAHAASSEADSVRPLSASGTSGPSNTHQIRTFLNTRPTLGEDRRHWTHSDHDDDSDEEEMPLPGLRFS
jgi:hypothetical protein